MTTTAPSKEYPSVRIKWADHWTDTGDTTLEAIKEKARPYYGEYVGLLAYENKQMVVLCSNVWENGDLSDAMFLMKKCIVERSDRE